GAGECCLRFSDRRLLVLYRHVRRGRFATLLGLADRETQTAALGLDAQDTHGDLLALLEHLFGVVDADGQLREVNKALDTILDAGKCAKRCDLGDGTAHQLVDVVAALHRRPRIHLRTLDGEGDLLLLLIHREHLHLDLLADTQYLAGVVDAAPGEL